MTSTEQISDEERESVKAVIAHGLHDPIISNKGVLAYEARLSAALARVEELEAFVADIESLKEPSKEERKKPIHRGYGDAIKLVKHMADRAALKGDG